MFPLLFVYGTLRTDQCNHHYLEKSTCIGLAETAEQYVMYSSGIPFVSKSYPGSQGSRSTIKGELFIVSSRTLSVIDHLEGHPDFYCREVITVNCDGVFYRAWIYFCNYSEGTIVSDGDWVSYNEATRIRGWKPLSGV